MALAAFEGDYLFMGALIEQRLAEQVPELGIKGIEQLSQATEENVRSLDAFVLWESDAFREDAGGQASRSSQMVTQTWTVLLAVRNASQVDKDGRNKAAGQWMAKIHRALHRWAPEGVSRPMTRTNGRKASYGGNTALLPLTFSITLNI
jgi:hypothetical protein